MAAGTLPAGAIARRYGRRAAFMTGAGCGVARRAPVAAWRSCSAPSALFCARDLLRRRSTPPWSQSFRFAAADTRQPGPSAPRAISWVMAGGVFAGVFGPQLVTCTMDIWPPYLFAASYLAQAGGRAARDGGRRPVRRPPAAARPRTSSRRAGRWPRSCASRASSSAALCGVVSLRADEPRDDLGAARHADVRPRRSRTSNSAIQWHVIAMYGPSFFTGSLIARFGAPRVDRGRAGADGRRRDRRLRGHHGGAFLASG